MGVPGGRVRRSWYPSGTVPVFFSKREQVGRAPDSFLISDPTDLGRMTRSTAG